LVEIRYCAFATTPKPRASRKDTGTARETLFLIISGLLCGFNPSSHFSREANWNQLELKRGRGDSNPRVARKQSRLIDEGKIVSLSRG
jgi:hypothetical protein